MATTIPTSSQSANLAYHLSDITLSPILSSNQSSPRALQSLTTTALTASDLASRLGLGTPQRIMIETKGPLILHSFLNPQSQTPPPRTPQAIIEQARDELRPLSGNTETTETDSPIHRENQLTGSAPLTNGTSTIANPTESTEESGPAQPPLLVATVIAPSIADAREARRLAGRIERIGKDFQREWVVEQTQTEERESDGGSEGEDG
ncbi:hypothetical protein HYALB_00002580 [Hymenoscyphus albidus]|uniref:Uncharacterized protein n=1 Tax=Hymenoscyphus albidus TaxID=595503 RepID=A0A9N9QAL1_9HELO|nr:hypothetical protein HYALB_00002580 [Hymenoscyphus albidus]